MTDKHRDLPPPAAPASPRDPEAPAQPGRRGVLQAMTLGIPGALAVHLPLARAGEQPAEQAAPGEQGGQTGTDSVAPLRFFNAQEAELMDAIAARLIPADDLGPGAKEAGVTRFLDGQLAGAWGAGDHFYRQGPFEAGTPEQGYQLSFTPAEMYRRGLAAFDEVVRKKEGDGFGALSGERQDAWLAAMQKGELDFDPLPAAVFFQALLEGAMEGFFSDPLYGGNAGMVGWKLVGFPGAYASFSSDIERHGVPWSGEPVSIAQARGHGHAPPSRDEPSPAHGGKHG